VTRPEIEEIRGTSLAQNTLDALLENGLIAPKGRREAPGRPTLWGTTPAFLTQFGLNDLRDLPRREDLVVEPPAPMPAEARQVEAPDPTSPEAQDQPEPEAQAEAEAVVFRPPDS
jgi:segregation and condensation protein B